MWLVVVGLFAALGPGAGVPVSKANANRRETHVEPPWTVEMADAALRRVRPNARIDPPVTVEEAMATLRRPNAHAEKKANDFPQDLPGIPTEKGSAFPIVVIQPPDILVLSIEGTQDASVKQQVGGEHPVRGDGTISLGAFGRINVAETTPGLAKMIIERHLGGFLPRVKVHVTLKSIGRFFVLGAVKAPGQFPLNGRKTVLDALVTAGGLTDEAARDKIFLVRPGKDGENRRWLPVDFHAIVQLGDTTTNHQLQPGDCVEVAERTPGANQKKDDPLDHRFNSPAYPRPPNGAVNERKKTPGALD